MRFRHAMRARKVLCEHTRAQPVRRAVGQRAMASSSVSNGSSDITGPNISTFQRFGLGRLCTRPKCRRSCSFRDDPRVSPPKSDNSTLPPRLCPGCLQSCGPAPPCTAGRHEFQAATDRPAGWHWPFSAIRSINRCKDTGSVDQPTRVPATQLWPDAPKLPAIKPFAAPSKIGIFEHEDR